MHRELCMQGGKLFLLIQFELRNARLSVFMVFDISIF